MSMKNKISSKLIMFILAMSFFCSGQLFAQQTQHQDDKDKPAIQINSYDIKIREWDKPVIVSNERGEKKEYGRAYMIELKGYFGEPRAIPLDIYMGNYKIPEYGGNDTSLYFYIYEDSIMSALEGKMFGYGLLKQKFDSTRLIFRPDSLRPFEKYEEIKNK